MIVTNEILKYDTLTSIGPLKCRIRSVRLNLYDYTGTLVMFVKTRYFRVIK